MTDRESAVALYSFLNEFAQLRTRTILDISRYEQDGQVIWAGQVPREPGCDCIAWRRDVSDASDGDGSDEVWLEIRKPRRDQPPEPPESLSPWVRRDQLHDSSLELPEVRSTLSDEPDESSVRLDDHPEVQRAWDAYIEDQWWPWAEQDRREQAVQRVYTDLFSMFQRQQRLGETFEIIFGLGFLSWNVPGSRTVQRHLVAARVSVSFDPESGVLTVTPAGEGARPTLEQEMLDPQHRPDPQGLRSIEETLETISESLWAAGPIDALLQSWVHSASARGEYRSTLHRPQHPGPTPVVHLAPALILRRRTERSFIRAFQEIIAQLNSGEPVPVGVSRFVGVSEDHTRSGSTSESSNNAQPDETYFPLPANDAQRQIVQRLATNQGVLVQGPPGTGKSHTIVNLICHALASGQRVLVTSHAVRALRVLRDMIREHAPDLAPLSVVLLGDDRGAMDAMEESVQGITTRQNSWTATESRARIASLEGDLDHARKREAKVLAGLRAIRERETHHQAKFGYSGTLAHIAETLRGERESLSWVHDATPEELDPPLPADRLAELLSLLRNENVGKWEVGGWVCLDVGGLPTTEEFEHAIHTENAARSAHEADAPIRQGREYDALEAMIEGDRLDLAHGLQKLISLIEHIEKRPLPWTGTATKQILGGFERTWRQLHEDTSIAATAMAESARWFDANPITPQPTTDLPTVRADARDLLDHFKANGGWGFGPFRTKVVKRARYVRDLRIGGRPCETADTVRDLVRRVDGELEVIRLRKRWALHYDFSATTFTDLATELTDLCERIEEAFAALSIRVHLLAILQRTPGIPEPDWSDPAALRRLHETLGAVEMTHRYDAARDQILQALARLNALPQTPRPDPASDDMRVAIVDRDARKYAIARQQAVDNAELAELLNRKRELLDRLTTGAPHLGGELKQTFADSVWDERVGDFERAWNWSRAHAWVTRLIEPGSEEQHRLELDQTKRKIAHTLERIAAEKAWTHCFSRMTENQRQHLVAWSKAVRSIGKGLGKYAALHRRNARMHLDECRSAIPAWVMPLHRVAETIKPGSELFDIAIIDEASQSGPEALLLAFLAKKLVVVGDDKQIHPTYAGVNFEDVNQLRERHIAGLPHSDSYGVHQSFFDLAEIRYQNRIRLREHFRCMPEIIQFSNNLSYASEPLIPLRQYGAGRLEPTITTRHVPDGYQKGTGARLVNPPEAEAIVKGIVRICGEPVYADKTIGVISLVGDAQAREIETRLVRELGPEPMERRQLTCGDAYAFQGDERDVMFLSMVSAPQENRRIPAMTDAAAQRRFNVAASRARDQLFLFHTATLSDLSPHCMRHQLLKYCLEPALAIADVAGLDVSEIERLAYQADRQRVTQPEPFDSWFEIDVFLRIARRGYRVIPQFEVAGYRIDLVVQGMDGSLAVECDADAWHGPDRYEQDVARQRDLERCGWTFWRIRDSAFRLDPDEALSDLWNTLENHRVFPTTKEEMRRGETRQAAEPPYPLDDPGDPSVANDSLGAPVQRAASSPDSEGHSERSSGQLLEQPNDAHPSDQSAKSESVRRLTDSLGVREQSPHERIIPLSRLEPMPANVHKAGGLAPYVEWVSTGDIPDPRTAKQVQLVDLLVEAVEREGPIVAIRAYRLINRASGSQRLTSPARSALNRAGAAAVRTGVVTAANPLHINGQEQLVLRRPERPEVIPRERGPRELDELPPDEVATLLRSLREEIGPMDHETLKRQALGTLGWVRLTRNISEFLDHCIALM